MTSLWVAPFNLLLNDNIYPFVMAHNEKGFNDSFSPNLTTSTANEVEWYPIEPGTPIRAAGTTWNVFVASWIGITNNSTESGGTTTEILSYHLQRNQGNTTVTGDNDVWVDLVGLLTPTLGHPLGQSLSRDFFILGNYIGTPSLSLNFTTSLNIIGGTTYKV